VSGDEQVVVKLLIAQQKRNKKDVT